MVVLGFKGCQFKLNDATDPGFNLGVVQKYSWKVYGPKNFSITYSGGDPISSVQSRYAFVLPFTHNM